MLAPDPEAKADDDHLNDNHRGLIYNSIALCQID
jgi:hypothetical protein